MNQMQNVAVAVAKEDEAVALVIEWLAQKSHALLLEVGVSLVEIIHCDRQVADPGIFHLIRSAFADRRDNFEHCAVLRLYEVVAVVRKIDVKLEIFRVPVGKGLRVGRCNRGVL